MGASTTTPDVDVLVVGAGIIGINQLYAAREAGFSVQLVEAGGGVGGCWYWNRYPGCRFDSESYTYGYLFSQELFDEWRWSEHFAEQSEIEAYLNHTVDKFDLRRSMRFDTRVVGARFDEGSGTWQVALDDGSQVRARYLIAATGVLSVPYIPSVPGRDTFKGEAHHTGTWPNREIDFTGKRVAVVGTSSSGVQVVQSQHEKVAEMVVYQRTANWCTPLNNRPITDAEQADLRANFEQIRHTLNTSLSGFLHPVITRTADEDTKEQRREFFEQLWNSPGFMKLTSNYADILTNDEANEEWCDFMAAKIRGIVRDPATAAKLIPTDHRFGEKRPPFVMGYFEAFNNPKVKLVDLRESPMTRITETGIETTGPNGVELREFDIIVWATGFDFGTGALTRMGITGRNGQALADHWADGPTTFLGIQTRGFPNLFFPGGPHGASGNNPRYGGDQVDFIVEVLQQARERDLPVVEASETSEERWTRMVDKAAAATKFGTIGQYVGGNVPGKPRRYLLNSGGRLKLFQIIADVKSKDFDAFEFTAP